MDDPASEPTPDYVPSWWERGRYGRANRRFDRSPTRVLAFYVVMGIIGLAIIVQAIVNPHAALHGYRSGRALVGAVLLLPIIVVYAPRAWRARRESRRASVIDNSRSRP